MLLNGIWYNLFKFANSNRQTGRNCFIFRKELPVVEFDSGACVPPIVFEFINDTDLTTELIFDGRLFVLYYDSNGKISEKV